jgi:hypothetical protein
MALFLSNIVVPLAYTHCLKGDSLSKTNSLDSSHMGIADSKRGISDLEWKLLELVFLELQNSIAHVGL